MELIYLDNNTKINDYLVATIGEFDGVHKGHLALLNKTLEIAEKEGLKKAVITFDPHPNSVLLNETYTTYITPFKEKKELFEKLGFDYLLVIKFTKEISKIKPIDFIEKYLINNNVKFVVVGFDFCFGEKRSGTAFDIENLSGGLIKTKILESINYESKKIASSWVKKSLNNGDVELANKLLGRTFYIEGEVVYGKQIGRTIDVPTANVSYDESYASLKTGVYACRVLIDDKKYPAITNIGHNPSFNYTSKRSLETHIINFDGDLYGKVIRVEFLKYLRNEEKFSDFDAFKTQIEKDKLACLDIILKYE